MQQLKQLITSKRVLPFVIVIAAIVLVILLFIANHHQPASPAAEKAWNVSVISAKQATYTPNLILHGSTESPQRAVMEAAIDADVIATPVYEGEIVKKGALLVKLDNREVKLELNQRTADVKNLTARLAKEKLRGISDQASLDYEKKLLELSQRAVRRQEQLLKEKVGSEAAYDRELQSLRKQELSVTNQQLIVSNHKNEIAQLEAQLAKAIAQENRAKLDYQRSQIYAPFDGRVTKLRVAVGNRVQKGEALIELYDLSNIEIRAQIPTHYVATIYGAWRNKIELTGNAILDQQPIKVRLVRLAGEVASGRGGVDALLKITNNNAMLPLGRSVEILLNLPPHQNVIKVPTQALYRSNRIYLVKDSRMVGKTVARVGLIQSLKSSNSYALIKSQEVPDGSLIVTTQLPNARSGLKVNVSQTSP